MRPQRIYAAIRLMTQPSMRGSYRARNEGLLIREELAKYWSGKRIPLAVATTLKRRIRDMEPQNPAEDKVWKRRMISIIDYLIGKKSLSQITESRDEFVSMISWSCMDEACTRSQYEPSPYAGSYPTLSDQKKLKEIERRLGLWMNDQLAREGFLESDVPELVFTGVIDSTGSMEKLPVDNPTRLLVGALWYFLRFTGSYFLFDSIVLSYISLTKDPYRAEEVFAQTIAICDAMGLP